MKASDLTIDYLKKTIEKQLDHSYLRNFLQKPFIDEDKLLILTTVIRNTNYSTIEKENYIVTTMLVQIALDTHDLVTQNSSESDTDITRKKRQLTVLAGDYYSGLYYYLLSKLNDIPMIHTLASAIKEINEHKMSFYYREFDSVSTFMESLKRLESILILRVAEHMHQSTVDEFTCSWLLIKKLLREKKTYLKTGSAPILDLLTKGPAHNIVASEIVNTVDKYTQQYITQIEKSISKLPNQFKTLKTHAQSVINDNLSNNIKVMEEG